MAKATRQAQQQVQQQGMHTSSRRGQAVLHYCRSCTQRPARPGCGQVLALRTLLCGR